MAKRKLISEPASFPDLTIIGISCQLKDYRLAFFLNRDMRLNLVRLEDLPVYSEKEDALFDFPLYTCYEPERRLNYYLMGNNNAGNKMIPAYKQADFLLMLKGQADNERSAALISGLRKIGGIQMVFQIENDKIKNLEGVMSDLELHLAKK
jgi:hypothetical protein